MCSVLGIQKVCRPVFAARSLASVILVPLLFHIEAGQIEHVTTKLFVSWFGHPAVDEMICSPLNAFDDQLVAIAAAVILESRRHHPESGLLQALVESRPFIFREHDVPLDRDESRCVSVLAVQDRHVQSCTVGCSVDPHADGMMKARQPEKAVNGGIGFFRESFQSEGSPIASKIPRIPGRDEI